MSYQKTTGPLMANSHPGSYCGQDAYNDMFVTEKKNDIQHISSGFSDESNGRQGVFSVCNGLQRSTNNFEGGARHGYSCAETYSA